VRRMNLHSGVSRLIFGGGGQNQGNGDGGDDNPNPPRTPPSAAQQYVPRSGPSVAPTPALPRIPDFSKFSTPQALVPARISVIDQAPGLISYFDRVTDVYVPRTQGVLQLLQVGPFQFELHILIGGQDVMQHRVDESLCISKVEHSVKWTSVANDGSGKVHSWKFTFKDPASERSFMDSLVKAVFETSTQERMDKAVGRDDMDYVHNAIEAPDGDQSSADDAEPMDFEDEFESDPESDFEEKSTPHRGRPSKVPLVPPRSTKRYVRARDVNLGQEKNDDLSVGMASNRTFVIRGSKIGVFRHNHDDELEYMTKIPAITDLRGKSFTPARSMLHERDAKMLFLNPDENDKVYCMDLERGKVVEEWGANESQVIRSLAPVEKYAQRTTDQMVLGVSHNALFSLDPRLSDSNKIAECKTYAQNPKMQVIATNQDGQVATGSVNGEIRLFSDISKRAKTLLPGLGDPLVGIDVTADGKYLLATTARYLLVVPTEVPDDAKARTGFDVSLGKNKPTPIKLSLRSEDLVKYNIDRVNFTPARFNIGDNIDEHWILTSTGPYLVLWNFNSIIKHKNRFDYRIQRCPQQVVADQFRFNRDKEMVVTLQDDVYLQKRA